MRTVSPAGQAGRGRIRQRKLDASLTTGDSRQNLLHHLAGVAFELPHNRVRNGAPVRFADVGTVIDGVENPRLSGLYNGQVGVTIGVNRQPGTNMLAIIDAVKAKLPAIRSQLPPSIKMEVTLVEAAIRNLDAVHDLIIGGECRG